MKTVVLDDDPTGTQSARDVRVLMAWDVDAIVAALTESDSVYLQTNSRAIDEESAVALVTGIRRDVLAAGERLGEGIQFVLRGDSTLRGHVFAETEVFAEDDDLIVFAPAFPAGGRTTLAGVHLVEIDGRRMPAHLTEYADDPVFPFASGIMTEYVSEKSARPAVNVLLDVVRAGRFSRTLRSAPAGAVIIPDAETDADVQLIATGIREAREEGRRIVVRCAAPLAAALAGVASEGLLAAPLVSGRARVLLACGSHTEGATRQLAHIEAAHGSPVVIDTDRAMKNPEAEGLRVAEEVGRDATADLLLIATDRRRRAEHNTLEHGERVMAALSTAVHALAPGVDVVVAKGGITSAELARTGLDATSAYVLGQVLPGVSVWRTSSAAGLEKLYVVVPGNVGGPDTLERVLESISG